MLVELTDKDILRLAQVVREETGNQVEEKNRSMLTSRIRGRVLKLGLSSMRDYWEHFRTNEEAERELIRSLMTTHYTFFFREFAHFEVLAAWIEKERERLKAKFHRTGAPVRVWSAACSRGQEAYSLATFLDINLTKKHGIPFEILGTDIDADSLAYARNGVYPLKEVNTIPREFLAGYWKKGTGSISQFAAVHPFIKEKVHFAEFNLTDFKTLPSIEKFDVIFCRNVFIYFSDENVRKISLNLESRLTEGGLFVSGVSEPLRFPEWALAPVGPSCYQRVIAERTEGIRERTVPAIAAVPSLSLSQGYRVLCVDDSSTILVLLKKIFAKDPDCKGVEIAVNGREAREKLNKGSFDLITLDIHMPEVNGIQFMETLYDRREDPPVLMVSSVNRADIDLATKSLSLGAFDYVEKPAMNNLQKSADEILTKAKMALRKREKVAGAAEESFDASIGRKIVVPDASQCLRVVLAGEDSMSSLEYIVKGQVNEYRSPGLLIVFRTDGLQDVSLAKNILEWTKLNVVTIHDVGQSLKPNHIYLLPVKDEVTNSLDGSRFKSASLQILQASFSDLRFLKGIRSLQVLADELLLEHVEQIQKTTGLTVSDVAPATSFPSLSLEFFANLRRAAA